MASCGEVDHSVSSLPSSKKVVEVEIMPNPHALAPVIPLPPFLYRSVPSACRPVFIQSSFRATMSSAFCADTPVSRRAKGICGGRGGTANDHAWYYEGRNGWWQYDERTSRELEDAFSKGKKTAEMLIAGFLYVADLENMVQYRRNEHGRRRKMKRDVLDIPKKGVAGLRLDTDSGSGAAGAVGRESSADGADTSLSAPQQPLIAPPLPLTVRPPTSLGLSLGAVAPLWRMLCHSCRLAPDLHFHKSAQNLEKERRRRMMRPRPPDPQSHIHLWMSRALEIGVMMKRKRRRVGRGSMWIHGRKGREGKD
ncbi:hypothetical protein WMY93_026721 [Mugilogobius chulae]|uniref:E3 ubiquitin-protein ligase n=1 Tax=Mugilogobius chulae TaxID=88201 RepID=A0AAW0N2Q3_9GOBI